MGMTVSVHKVSAALTPVLLVGSYAISVIFSNIVTWLRHHNTNTWYLD